jgi:hypothetical protein
MFSDVGVHFIFTAPRPFYAQNRLVSIWFFAAVNKSTRSRNLQFYASWCASTDIQICEIYISLICVSKGQNHRF